MKKLAYLLFLAVGIVGCSVDSLENEADFQTADMKVKTQNTGEAFIVPKLICAGEEAEFCLTFPQATTGNGKLKTTNVQVQLFDVETEEWIQIFHEDHHTEACFNYTFDEVRAYDLRYQIGGGGFTKTSVVVEDCCEESFLYVDNEDGTYTFTYTAGEDMVDAELVFTFAQGVAVDGLDSSWEQNGHTRQTIMDLTACESYTWTVTLSANCSGSAGHSNVWTDFKVNDVSKKADEEDKFRQLCH